MERQSLLALTGLRAAMLLVAGLCLLLTLAPAGLAPAAPAMPDLVTLVLLSWMIRRPEAVPLLLLMAVSLSADLLRGAPLGIGTLYLLAASELLVRMQRGIARNGFLTEWLTVCIVLTGMLAVQCLSLWLSFAPLPPAGSLLRYLGMTAMLYPAVLFLQRALLPLHAPRLPEVEL